MEKRYQVFVSSTYEDLQEERREVMQALLELDCIPAGMELFPASNEEQWDLIKRVIDDSDYYILIVGGRYGSTDKDGIGYTEKEYRYALEINKPTIAFFHKYPGKIQSDKTEQTNEGKEKLALFKELVEQKISKFWTNPDDLGSVVSRSMIKLIKQFPATGWVKADSIIDENSMKKILLLQKENEELGKQLNRNKTQAPKGTETLAQGEDKILLNLYFDIETDEDYETLNIPCEVTWNEIYSEISPHLLNESSENKMKEIILNYLKKKSADAIYDFKEKYIDLTDFEISSSEFQKLKIQLRALGLIKQAVRPKYWTLTEYGDYAMTQLVAIKK